jgi:hypothetical protein
MKAKTKLLDQISFSSSCKSTILGTILGDGSLKIQKGFKNARLSVRHSEINKSYFLWKVKELREISSFKSIQVQKPSGFSKNNKLLFQSKALENLTIMYNYLYEDKKLRIRRRWLNKLTPQSLMIWWLDDGSIISNNRRGVICTDGFEKDQIQILVKYLKVVWKVNSIIYPIKKVYKGTERVYYRIFFSTEELKKFLRIFFHLIPVAEMVYKVCLIYKDSTFQERWTSELINALPQFKVEIEALIRQKMI